MTLEVSLQDLHDAYTDLFTSQSGQIVMADLIRCFGFTDRLILGNDTHQTYFHEGRRSVLLHMQMRLAAPPDITPDDVKEAEYDEPIAGTDDGVL